MSARRGTNRDRITLHWAINSLRNARSWRGQRSHPFGRSFDQPYGAVRCLVPEHTYLVASACRVERDNWHNRIHHSYARYLATNNAGVMEYGIAACGASLVDPLYTDAPVRMCDCGGTAAICPRCEAIVHRNKPGCVEVAA